jgi:hypothetical protein
VAANAFPEGPDAGLEPPLEGAMSGIRGILLGAAADGCCGGLGILLGDWACLLVLMSLWVGWLGCAFLEHVSIRADMLQVMEDSQLCTYQLTLV